jgi:hypothetical protein
MYKKPDEYVQLSTTMILAGLFALISLLVGCARPAAAPVRASWADQRAAAERALKTMGDDFVLVGGLAEPVRIKQGSPDEAVELKVLLSFLSQKSSQVNVNGTALHAMRVVHFKDYHLAETLRVDDEDQRAESPDPTVIERARLIQIGPQDVLQLTRKEGEAYMGKPVDRGNISITLPRASVKPSELKDKAVWEITFYRIDDEYLTIWVDAQTGALVMRSEKGK